MLFKIIGFIIAFMVIRGIIRTLFMVNTVKKAMKNQKPKQTFNKDDVVEAQYKVVSEDE